LAGVNVTLAGDAIPSVASLDDRPMVTSAVGCAFSTTVKVAVAPASVVIFEIRLIVIPGVSLSLLVTVTSVAFRLL
jgi:hypothetical protein